MSNPLELKTISKGKIKAAAKSSLWSCFPPIKIMILLVAIFTAIGIFIDLLNDQAPEPVTNSRFLDLSLYIFKILFSYVPYYILLFIWLLFFTKDGLCTSGSLIFIIVYTILYYVVVIGRKIIVNYTTISKNWEKFKRGPIELILKKLESYF